MSRRHYLLVVILAAIISIVTHYALSERLNIFQRAVDRLAPADRLYWGTHADLQYGKRINLDSLYEIDGIFDTVDTSGVGVLYDSEVHFRYEEPRGAFLILSAPENCNEILDDVHGRYVLIRGRLTPKVVGMIEVERIYAPLPENGSYDPSLKILECGNSVRGSER